MLLRTAVRVAQSLRARGESQLSLVCSFEPLHLGTFIQAMLVERLGPDAPRVESFGFDQLVDALRRTATVARVHPAALCLTWEDMHPALTWRARGGFHQATIEGITASAQALTSRVLEWVEARRGADTFIALPPREWLPEIDSAPSATAGERTLCALREMAAIASAAASLGAHVLTPAIHGLNYRDLLSAGCPLTVEDAELLASQLIRLAYRATERKKGVVLDLDGTLWDGVIGEDGRDTISARAEGKGYPFFVFQHVLLRLKHEGVLLAVCSKNNPSDVLPHFDQLGMPLRLEDFAAVRCNWAPKAKNIRDIARELNIGTSSLVYVDDNPAELAHVQAELPEVQQLQAPREAAQWPAFFTALQDFTWTWRVSEEDRIRTSAIRLRGPGLAGDPVPSATRSASDLSYLQELELKLMINSNAFADARSLELINKTNQFNLNGIRIAAAEWLTLQAEDGAVCVSGRLGDKFGDFGTIVVAVGRLAADRVFHIQQMVMSCRAFGRTVEWAALLHIVESLQPSEISGSFVPTGKNDPTRTFLSELGIATADGKADWRVSAADVARIARRNITLSGMRTELKEALR